MSAGFLYPSEPDRPAPKPLPTQRQDSLSPHSLWYAHDPAVYHDPVSGDYFVYCTGGWCLRSPDLIRWTRMGKAIAEPPAEAETWTGSKAIWAPDIVKEGNEYRLYCSNSSWGSQQSCIFLAVADRAEGPFSPKGIVFRSSDNLNVNAIDANIIEDVHTGRQYMVYGSFWGGCHMIELDKETGLALLGSDTPGHCIARRPDWADHAIEGPYIIYHPDTGYYYLFVSYGSLKSDYNIRVGRSRTVTGPYLDHNGRDMTDMNDDDNTLGYMPVCGYKFDDHLTGWMGPGHNSVLHDFDNRWYLVSHIRPHNFHGEEPSTMHVRKMLWTSDGWPVVSPECYTGEKRQPVTEDLIRGNYERIKLQPMVPQGTLTSVKMSLKADGTGVLADSVRLTWELTDPYTLHIRYANTTENLQILPAWDYEVWRPTLVLTGTDQSHICIWAKKRAAT